MSVSLHGIKAGRASHARPTQNSNTFSATFSVFINFTSATVLILNPQILGAY